MAKPKAKPHTQKSAMFANDARARHEDRNNADRAQDSRQDNRQDRAQDRDREHDRDQNSAATLVADRQQQNTRDRQDRRPANRDQQQRPRGDSGPRGRSQR